MRDNFKVVNGREVRTIGYDADKKMCVIAYNHLRGGKNVYYHNVTQEQFDILLKSDDIAGDAELVLKDNTQNSILTG